MSNAYYATGLIGGGAGDLDFYDGAALVQDDFAFALEGNVSYVYKLEATSGATPSSPDIITPITNAGDKRWILNNSLTASVNHTGVVELATDVEAEDKTETDRALVPSNLGAIFLDEDDMASNSDTKVCSQQSIIEYVGTVRDIPVGEVLLFYKDTAVVGYSLMDTVTYNDKTVYVTRGSVAGGQTGGAIHSSGSWSHSHTYNTVIAHTHTTGTDGDHLHTLNMYGGGTTYGAFSPPMRAFQDASVVGSANTSSTGGHSHTVNSTGSASGTTADQTSWRPAACNFTMQERI